MTERPVLPLFPLLDDTQLPLDGCDWNAVTIVRGIDGDTVRLLRAQWVWRVLEDTEVGDALRRTRWEVERIRDDEVELPDGLAGRLINLNTPERGKSVPGGLGDGRAGSWAEARDDLARWCGVHAGRIRCIAYTAPSGVSGGFDRLLVDLYVMDVFGIADTASQFMLRIGWPPYLES